MECNTGNCLIAASARHEQISPKHMTQGGVVMKWYCKECGRFSLRLNKEEECPDCARKEEEMKSYFTKLRFIAPSVAKLVPAN